MGGGSLGRCFEVAGLRVNIWPGIFSLPAARHKIWVSPPSLCYSPGMTAPPQNNPILKRFRTVLDEMYGDRLARVVLFGSRARGDAREDSDYDIAVFLQPLGDRWQELDRLAALRLRFMDETSAFI